MLGNAMHNDAHSPIFDIMHEEYLRLIEAEQSYAKAIAKLPKGSPRIKQIRNKEYLYLARREENKVVDYYIGPAQQDKAQQVLEQVEKRQRLAALLKQVKRALKDVKKVLRGKI